MNLSNDPLLAKCITTLKKYQQEIGEQFYAWDITIKHHQSLQSLLLGRPHASMEQYQKREVLDHLIHIEIFSCHGAPQVMGNSFFTVDPLADLAEQIKKTFKNSLLVSNKPWKLPTKVNGDYAQVETVDPIIAEDMHQAHSQMLKTINDKIKVLDKVNVNSGELFTNLKTSYFETSFGLKGQKMNSDIYFEIAVEKNPRPNTQEVLKYKKAISIEDLNLSQFIDEVIAETLSIAETKVPQTSKDATILVDGDTISDLLNKILSQLNAECEFKKSPFMLTGDSLIKGEKNTSSDQINITLDPSTPVMTLTTPYTAERMKPMKAEIIKDDVVLKQIINNRYGQYLSKDANYIAGNMLVKSGNMTKEELLNSVDECLEIISFASLLINQNTLTWSSEIKLAKRYLNGKFDCMIKGGVVSGNIKENLANFKFSNSQIRINVVAGGFAEPKGYIGPNAMLIKSGVKVVGE